MNTRPQLLCTFTTNHDLIPSIRSIRKVYENITMQIDMYSTPTNIVCIYNVTDKTKRLPDTISINKKKETNTYYSINALNSLIKLVNNGVLDKTYVINWHDYVNCMLLSAGQEGYKSIPLEKINHI